MEQQSNKTLASKNFEISTEIDVVRLLLKKSEFAATYADHISPFLFREQLKPIVEITLKYWQQYRKLIPPLVLVQELTFKIGTGFTVEKRDAILQILYQLQTDPQAPEYTEKLISEFIRFQRVENSVVESLKILKKADVTQDYSELDKIAPLVEKANHQITISKPSFFIQGIEERTDYRTQLACGDIDFTGFGTGIPDLDELCPPYYGLAPGQVGVWVGATGRGKSIALLHCGFISAFRNLPVAYFSLELPEMMLLDRFDAMTTKTEVKDIINKRMEVRQQLIDMQQDYNIAEIAFRELAFAEITVSHIRNELKRLQQVYNFEPRLICIDYMDLMRPMRKTKEGGWKEQQLVTEELHLLANETKTAIWTASQGNRGAANKNDEGDLLSDADVAESYNKLFAADFVVTINRTKAQMAMPEPKPAWLNVVKNRTGIGNRKVGVLTNFGKMQFYVGAYDDSHEKLAEESLKTDVFKKKGK